jgi:hypothetical protein
MFIVLHPGNYVISNTLLSNWSTAMGMNIYSVIKSTRIYASMKTICLVEESQNIKCFENRWHKFSVHSQQSSMQKNIICATACTGRWYTSISTLRTTWCKTHQCNMQNVIVVSNLQLLVTYISRFHKKN